MTAQFGDELDQLRQVLSQACYSALFAHTDITLLGYQEKNFDESKISLLIDVLEAGVGLYDEAEREHLMLRPNEEKDGKQGAGVNIFRVPKAVVAVEKEERLPAPDKVTKKGKETSTFRN